MKYFRSYVNLRLELTDTNTVRELIRSSVIHWQLQNARFSDAGETKWLQDPDDLIRIGAARYTTVQFESSEINIRDDFGSKLSFTWVNDQRYLHSFNAVSNRVEQADHAAKMFSAFCLKANAIYGVMYTSHRKEGVLECSLGRQTFLSEELIAQLKFKLDDFLSIPNTECERVESSISLRVKTGVVMQDLQNCRVARSIKWPLNFPRKMQGVKFEGKGFGPQQLLGDYKEFIKNANSYAHDLLGVPPATLGKDHLSEVLSKYNDSDIHDPAYPELYRRIVAALGTIVCNETAGSWGIRGIIHKKLTVSVGQGFSATRCDIIDLLEELAQNEEARVAFLARLS